MKSVVALWLVFVLATFASAASDGDVSAEGHTFRKGLWWKGGVSYLRTVESGGGYWYCGRYYYRADYYRYYPYTPPAAAKEESDESEFDLQLARLARIRLLHKNSLEKINALGLTGSVSLYPQFSGIGTVPYAALPNIPYSYGVTANTVYGYAQNQQASFQGYVQQPTPVDLNQIALYLNQSLVRASDLQAQGYQGMVGFASAERDNQFVLRRMALQRDMVLEFLRATADPAAIKSTNVTLSITPQGALQPRIPQGIEGDGFREQVNKAWLEVKPQCATCHSGEAALKNKVLLPQGFDVDQYEKYTPDMKEVVWERIITKDEKRRMPRNPDNSPGKPLAAHHKQAIFLK